MKQKLSENIKNFRTERGLTQGELAALLSVSPQAVSRWETGQAYPDIELLPALADYLNTSVDLLLGFETSKSRWLIRELNSIKAERNSPEGTNVDKELRYLDICEELCHIEKKHSKVTYLSIYFGHLMDYELWEKLGVEISEERRENARQMIRDAMHELGMADRIELLYAVGTHEDEDKLSSWEYEYKPSRWRNEYYWDDILLQRYWNRDKEKHNFQRQKIIYSRIVEALFLLLVYVDFYGAEQEEFCNPAIYQSALDTIGAYSTRVDDVFLNLRIVAQVRYAETLLLQKRNEEGLKALAVATEWLRILSNIPYGKELYGSSAMLDGFFVTVDDDYITIACIGNLGYPGRRDVYDDVINDSRCIEYAKVLKSFRPENVREFCTEEGTTEVDATWESLMKRARAEVEDLEDGGVAVLLTEKGNVHILKYSEFGPMVEAEGALKFFASLKKNDDVKLDRFLWMHYEESIGLPPKMLRDVIVSVEDSNKDTLMLNNGLNGYVTRTLGEYQ